MGMAAESQLHVLAVDDSSFDLKFIERLLQKSSFQVTSVESGSEALELLGSRVEVDLIITDYCMPGMTGYDLLKKLKESSVFKNIPVVIMSSENVPARINKCLEDGAEEFFIKPVSLADLNKLKTQLMETKSKNQKLEEIETPSQIESGAAITTVKPEIKDSGADIEIEILPLQEDSTVPKTMSDLSL